MLLEARRRGTAFDRVLTFGRIELAVLPRQASDLLRAEGLSHENVAALAALPRSAQFAEPVFAALGAREVLSLDASAYQAASLVHDMNQPLPDSMKQGFDVVFDGGSIEHVFNFPVAIRNCMELLKPGGSLIIHTAANNCMGHGFYQFSPELFYRVFSPDNGFEVVRMVVHGSGPFGSWYDVADPAVIRSRVELISFMPTQLLLHVRRSRVVPIFARAPQQSDYVTEWDRPASVAPGEPAAAESGGEPGWIAGCRDAFPRAFGMGRALRTAFRFYRSQSLWNRRFFRKAPPFRPGGDLS
jgi:SAM-dependent methyltransferase